MNGVGEIGPITELLTELNTLRACDRSSLRFGPGIPIPLSGVPRAIWALRRLGDEVNAVEFAWPPRLSHEQQQVAVYAKAQSFIRFAPGVPPGLGLSVLPRRVRQLAYREAA